MRSLNKKKTALFQNLVHSAQKARLNAYAPYSRFKVGAAVLAGSGKIYSGCNVENASFGLTLCAERTAIAQAILAGETRLIRLAVVAQAKTLSPCGACRQSLFEFSPDCQVMCVGSKEIWMASAAELLPRGFQLKK